MALLIKICGIRREEDARAAFQCGATHLGLVFVAESPRAISFAEAMALVAALRTGTSPSVRAVGVFVNTPTPIVAMYARSIGLAAVQLHGDEPNDTIEQLAPIVPVWKAVRIGNPDGDPAPDSISQKASRVLLDTWHPSHRGGTGVPFPIDRARPWIDVRPCIVAGGLSPENVADRIRALRPAGVDVSSGVESAPGIKDSALIAAFVRAAKDA